MPAHLLALSDGPSIILEKPIVLMGRHEECDVQLNSKKVSRKHCRVAQVNDYLIVRDLGSTNGVRINGQRVLEGKLKAGDELTVGNFRYQVFFDRADSPMPVPVPVKSRVPTDSLLEEADSPIPIDDSSSRLRPVRSGPSDKIPEVIDSSFVLPEKLRFPPPPKR